MREGEKERIEAVILFEVEINQCLEEIRGCCFGTERRDYLLIHQKFTRIRGRRVETDLVES